MVDRELSELKQVKWPGPRKLGRVLVAKRGERKEGRGRAAIKLGVSRATLARWELGKGEPSKYQLATIEKYLEGE